jgi:hypothetical protein
VNTVVVLNFRAILVDQRGKHAIWRKGARRRAEGDVDIAPMEEESKTD